MNNINWRNVRIAGSMLFSSMLCTNTNAENFEPAGYVGAAYGMIDVNSSEFEDDDTVGKIYLGGKFGRFIGIEGSINDFGEASNDLSSWELDGKALALVGHLPFNDRFGLFAKVGKLWWEADVSVLGFDVDLDGTEQFAGVGAQFNFTDFFSMRVEYERYDIEFEDDEIGVDVDSDSKVNVASLGLQFNF